MRVVARLLAVVALAVGLSLPAIPMAVAGEVTVSLGDRVQPAEVTVAIGTTVTWVNDDDERHRVRSRDGVVEFDSGNLEPGERFSFVFEAAGDHPYVDERDPDDAGYHGTVTVTDGHAGGDGATEEPTAGGGGGGGSVAPTSAEVAILDRSFSPRSVTVDVGSTVTWANRSDREHTVTFTDGGGSGELGSGGAFRHTFETAGTYDYLCALHPEMTGTVTVTGDGDRSADVPPPAAGGPGSDTGGRSTGSDARAASDPTSAPGGHAAAAVRIVELAFEPERVTVAAGATVTWHNAGAAPHTVTGSDFDSGTMRSGAAFSRRFDAAGTYAYRCTLHPQMTGEVVVLQAGAVTGADDDRQRPATPAATTAASDPAPPGPRPAEDRDSGWPNDGGEVAPHALGSASSTDGRHMAVIGFIVAGLVIGALARLFKPGRQNLGLVATLLLGLTGSVIGGVIANVLGTGGIFELNFLGFVVAVIAAILLIGIFEAAMGRRRT